MPEANLILSNANVITLTHRQARAQAIAILDGRIIDVGANRKIQTHAGKKTEIINCKDKTVVPGFVDCHVHMKEFGLSLQQVDLRNAKSTTEIQRILRQHAEKHPEQRWIIGGRWDQEKLNDKRYPTRWDLDLAVSEKPVLLNRVCGHLAVVNSKALRLAGITKRTEIRGGEVK